QRSTTVCYGLGQNPQTAFPVCGTASFEQRTVPTCGGRTVPNPACRDNLTDVNPFWYKFTCFETGTLGFLITPSNLSDDYDWQLFDITGRDASAVYTDVGLVVASNWSGEGGLTGASSQGKQLNICGGGGQPLFSKMPTITKGRQYLLLISHFTDSQSGYKLSFGGGTGSTTLGSSSITDTTPPHLSRAVATCDAASVVVYLNKKMRCSSLAADGSDFRLSTGAATITSAVTTSCQTGFDMDSVRLTLSAPLPVGTYKVISKKGTDGNTIIDYCDNFIPESEEITFDVLPLVPTPMDSLITPACAPGYLDLVFKKGIACASIASNGSDFVVSGPSAVNVVGASGECDGNGFTRSIRVQLSAPIQAGGLYTLTLKNGTDLNTIIDLCGQETPAGSSVSFSLKDTVSADFSYNTYLGCRIDTVTFENQGLSGVNSWQWSLADGKSSAIRNPVAYYNIFGQKRIRLIVSNGFCTDTVTKTVNLDNSIKANIKFPDIICPEEPAVFEDASTGHLIYWSWNFGNGQSSTMQNPTPQPYTLPPLTRELNYNVRLVIGNELGCYDTANISVKAVSSCYITVPSAFTPNHDGKNDFLYPLNAFKATDLSFRVFNRYGQLVFETNDWQNKWDGTVNGKLQPAGAYVWTLSYTEIETGKKVSTRGSSALIR
ncbi:MAG: gliding motility-associated C-terminal domain-containing protein, partial [Flavitalea sp.]